MNIKNYKDYAAFDYEQSECPNYNLGDVVINDSNEIGIIIQIHDEDEYRTDEFGNVSSSEIRMATDEEIKKYRPNILTPPNLMRESKKSISIKNFIKQETIKLHKKTILESQLKKINAELNILKEDEASGEQKSYNANVYKSYKKDLEDVVRGLSDVCNKLETAALRQESFSKTLPEVDDRTNEAKKSREIIIDIFKEVKKAKISAERKLYEMN